MILPCRRVEGEVNIMRATDDLTKGGIERQLAALALPLIAGNLFQQLYNAIDAFVIGRYLGHAAFAAAGVAGGVMHLFLFMISGGCHGMSILLAELYGKKDWEALKKESFLSFAFGCLLTAALAVAGFLTLSPLLCLLQTPSEVLLPAQSYLRIIYVGLPAAFFYHWCASALRAAGDTQSPLWALAASMGVNVCLDFFFVAACRAQIAGAALATVISQLFAAAVLFLSMRRRHPRLLFGRGDMAMDCGQLLRTARFGMVSALHQSSLYIGKLLVQGAVNTAGTETIAAYTAAARIEGFANSFGDSGSAAMSVWIAQNRGAGNIGRVKQGFRRGAGMMLLVSLCLSLLMVLLTPPALRWLAGEGSDALRAPAMAYMRRIAPFYLLCFLGNAFVGLYRGLGMVQIPVLGTILHISIRVLLSYQLMGEMGLAAVAVATGLGWAAVVVCQAMIYRRVRRRL